MLVFFKLVFSSIQSSLRLKHLPVTQDVIMLVINGTYEKIHVY